MSITASDHFCATSDADGGLSQERLAVSLGCHRTYVWRLEHGLRHPSRFLLRLLAHTIELTQAELDLLDAFDVTTEHGEPLPVASTHANASPRASADVKRVRAN